MTPRPILKVTRFPARRNRFPGGGPRDLCHQDALSRTEDAVTTESQSTWRFRGDSTD